MGVVCHGYRQLANRFLECFRPLDDGATIVIAPEGLSRFYAERFRGEHGPASPVSASWMTREDRENDIHDYINYLDVLYARAIGDRGVSNLGVFALGFSQGAATVSRWVVHGVARIDHLILWGGLLPPDLDLHTNRAELAKLRLSFVLGTEDEFIKTEAVETQRQQLADLGIASRLVQFDGGHVIDADALAEVLGKES